jgi:hypothetical protein
MNLWKETSDTEGKQLGNHSAMIVFSLLYFNTFPNFLQDKKEIRMVETWDREKQEANTKPYADICIQYNCKVF